MASFADVESAGEAVANVIGAGIVPAGLEMMDKLATRAVEDFVHAGYDLEAEAILLAESDGTREEVAHEIAQHDRGDARERRHRHPRARASDAERLRFWSGRKAAFPAVGRISPDYYCIDGSIPRGGARRRCCKRIEELSARYGLRCANVFHAGDGNLHPLILYDANIPGELETTERFAARHPRAVRRGGRHDHRRARRGHREDQPDVHAVPPRRARAVPRGEGGVRSRRGCSIPARRVPTLHRCAEYGAMRVKGGRAAASGPAALLMNAVAEAEPSQPGARSGLRAIRPALAVIADDEGLKPFETDAFIAHRETPMLAVLPETEDAGARDRDARAARSACRSSRAAPAPASRAARFRTPTACCWCCRRCARMLDVDPPRAHRHRRAGRAQPLGLGDVAAPHGLFYAPDPVEPVDLLDRRQRRRELGRRALPQVRAHDAQPPRGARGRRATAT